MGYICSHHGGFWATALGPGLAEDTAMTIEVFYLTTQLHHWLNLQVARHLEAQTARLQPASPEGIGMSGCNRPADQAGDPETIDDTEAGAGCSHAGSAARRRDEQTVHA
jgi:hypothetical protein